MQGRPIILLNKRSSDLALYSSGFNPTRIFCTDRGLFPRGMAQVRLESLDALIAFNQTSRVVCRWVVPIRASKDEIICCEGALTVPFLHISVSCGLANPQNDPCSVVLHVLAGACIPLSIVRVTLLGRKANRLSGSIWPSPRCCATTRSHSASHQRGDTSLITLKYLIRGSAQSGLVAMHPSTCRPLLPQLNH